MVAAADGPVLLRRVQPEGKRSMSGDEYLRGQPALVGARVGALRAT